MNANVVLTLSLSADVIVTGARTFRNVADVEDPVANLVGIAASASQGAVTAAQIDERPIMRAGEVLETVPGLVVSQHSGEVKANQYCLRGFNLDHGTDFSTTVADAVTRQNGTNNRVKLVFSAHPSFCVTTATSKYQQAVPIAAQSKNAAEQQVRPSKATDPRITEPGHGLGGTPPAASVTHRRQRIDGHCAAGRNYTCRQS